MGRPELSLALRSVAAQDYPCLDVIVVDATGGRHPPMPPISWRPGHTVRLMSNGQRLNRPQAGNLGLESIQGDFFCFLDDDDTYEPQHVSALVDEARHHPQALLLYARGNLLKPDNSVEKLFGMPFNRAILFHGPICFWQTALIRRQVIDLGCRFDETFLTGEDHDFLEQIAVHGDFIFLPHLRPTFNYRPDTGTSGTGRGNNVDDARRLYFDNLKLAKWAGERHYHAQRAAIDCKRAIREYHSGNIEQARATFEAVMRAYPGDMNASHGLARLDLEAGRPESALKHVLSAIELDPRVAEFQYTAALVHQALGNTEEARQAAVNALADPLFRSPASALLAQLADAPPPHQSAAAASGAMSRLMPCSCGSGKRYKFCCGSLAREVGTGVGPAPVDGFQSVEVIVHQAQRLLQRGEAEQAAAMLALLAPENIHGARAAQTAGEIYLRMHMLQPAHDLLKRAIALDNGFQALEAFIRCCSLMFRDLSRRSANQTLRVLLERLNVRAGQRVDISAAPRIHVVCRLNSIGGTERRALNLFRRLSGHERVELWSTEPALALYTAHFPVRLITQDDAPSGGTLVLVGTYFSCDEWLENSTFERIVICHNLADEYPSLMARLIQIEQNESRPSVELVFPSTFFKNATGLPGQVEYPPCDVTQFSRRAPRTTGNNLVIGRHGRDNWLKFHPNDPSFLRALMARGHRVRILGGTCIRAAFVDDPGPRPELLPVATEDVTEFLGSLDVFIYRKHPEFVETGGTAILEAMAMGLPIIAFPEQCGVAELIEHGRNGYLVNSESDAMEFVDRLSCNLALRERIGRAARNTVVELMQREHLLDVAKPLTGPPDLHGSSGQAHRGAMSQWRSVAGHGLAEADQ